jgi:hypothetical protein
MQATSAALEQARADGQPWHVLARILSEAIGARERTWPLWTDFWDRAQAPAALSVVILKRYVKTLRRLEQIAVEAGMDPAALLPPSFTAAEIAVRLHERDPESGVAALRDLRQRRLGIEELRRRLERAPLVEDVPPRGVVMAGRAAVVEDIGTVFAAAVPGMFGIGAVSVWRPALRHFCRLGFDVRSGTGNLLAGADVYLSNAAGRSDVLEDLAQSVLLSFYMPAFLILIGPGGAGTLAAARRAGGVLDLLEAPWIGILSIDVGGEVVPVREARGRPPLDRTAGYAAILDSFGGRSRSPRS